MATFIIGAQAQCQSTILKGWKQRSSGGRKDRQAEPHKQPIYGKQKETHELIFSWLSWLAVLLVGA